MVTVNVTPQIAPQGPSGFSSVAHAGNAVWKAILAIGVAVSINDVSQIAPTLNTISHYWLTATEFVWRVPSDLLGQPFFHEVAAAMTCYVSLMGIALSALWLEERKSQLPRPLSDKQKIALKTDWYSRSVQSLVPASIATIALVASVEYIAFQRMPNELFGSVPFWFWTMHALAIGIAFLVIVQFGVGQLLKLASIGILCGILFIAIALPSATEAAKKDIDAIEFYRAVFLKYAIVKFPFSFALVMALPSSRFLFAQLLAVCGLVSLILGIGWLATRS